MPTREACGDRLHVFRHAGTVGAAIQVMQPAQWDLNRMLPESLRLASDSVVTYTHACHYLQHGGTHVMVDAGFDAAETSAALGGLDVSPDDIGWVLITHGDGDHVAGLLTSEDQLAFPTARYAMSRNLWEHWHDASALLPMSEGYQSLYRTLAHLLADRVLVLEQESEVLDGVRSIPIPGHRHGHCAYAFATAGTPILHSGDSFFHPLFVENPDWPDILALNPEQEVRSRRLLLARAANTNALVLTCHIPFPGMGTVCAEGNTYRWQPTPSSRRSRPSPK